MASPARGPVAFPTAVTVDTDEQRAPLQRTGLRCLRLTERWDDMEFELKGALKKYRRMRSWRRAGVAIMALGAMSAPWLLNLGRTDGLTCWLGALTLFMTSELEMRLKTMQIRLAGMSDQLNALTRRDPERGPDDDLILELNDW
jgi:hypothetical protein